MADAQFGERKGVTVMGKGSEPNPANHVIGEATSWSVDEREYLHVHVGKPPYGDETLAATFPPGSYGPVFFNDPAPPAPPPPPGTVVPPKKEAKGGS